MLLTDNDMHRQHACYMHLTDNDMHRQHACYTIVVIGVYTHVLCLFHEHECNMRDLGRFTCMYTTVTGI